jgi:hypothetical protein
MELWYSILSSGGETRQDEEAELDLLDDLLALDDSAFEALVVAARLLRTQR